MRRHSFKRKPLTAWVAYSLATASIVGTTLAFAAAPAAGTEIKNLATVTYEDSLGNTYQAQSNEAIITVAAQYKASVGQDKTVTGAPGQTVYFPHTINNTGNESDTYIVTASDLTTPANGPYDVYLDANGNGQPDAGERKIDAANPLTLEAGEMASLIIAYSVPTTATATSPDTEIELKVVSSNNSAIVDETDGTVGTTPGEQTNTNTLKVSTEAVLVSTKNATIDEANNTITYTLTVKNVGGSDAEDVVIFDTLPLIDTDNDGVSDAQVTLVGTPILNGFTEGWDTKAAEAVTDETTAGANVDGGLAMNSSFILAVDQVLPVNTVVSVQFTVQYDPTWKAGDSITNEFRAVISPTAIGPATPAGPIDPTTIPTIGPGEPIDPATVDPSNKTTTEIPVAISISVSDTGTADPDSDPSTTNDGGDDDGTKDGVQMIDSGPAGATLLYPIEITNSGNGEDIFNLTSEIPGTDGFPPGTVVTFWNADGTVQLTDSDGDGIPDTGVLDPDPTGTNPQTFLVKVSLPSGVSSATPVKTIVSVTSSEDPTKLGTIELKVGEIIAPTVDIAIEAVTVNGVAAADLQTVGVLADNTINAQENGPVGIAEVLPSNVVILNLKMANESGSSESYVLNVRDVPEGWEVVFKDSTGTIITSTPFIPSGSEFAYTAEVTISTNPTQVLAEAPAVGNNVNGYNADGNTANTMTPGTDAGDTDIDYVISFIATAGSNTSTTDTVLYSFDAKASDKDVMVSPDGQNQIAPGGTVDYKHKLSNEGNTTKVFEVDVTNNQTGWNSLIMFDTDGDGIPDKSAAEILASATPTITVKDENGNPVTLTLTDTDGDGKPEITLEPGQYVQISNKVTSPANAGAGVVNTSTVALTDPTDGDRLLHSAEDNTNTIMGQVRLNKTVAPQTDCTDAATIGTFAEIQSVAIEPGQCAVWKLVAKNEGTGVVQNVVITDDVPEYTTIYDKANTLKYCFGSNCTPVSGAANIVETGGTVTANVGTGATATVGGNLESGEEATVMFTIKIDE